jgi:hypothetical protein
VGIEYQAAEASLDKTRETPDGVPADVRGDFTLDLADRASDQFAGLENLPHLAAVLRRRVEEDLSLAGGRIAAVTVFTETR